MKNLLIVSFEKNLEAHMELARDYFVAFEINDFYDPDVLDNPDRINEIEERYRKIGIPLGSTMHGAFFDVLLHSRDAAVRKNSQFRMRQSMEIAKRLGLKAVIFHINYQPGIVGDEYEQSVIEKNSEFVEELLRLYPEIDIYLENMFEDTPKIIVEISKRLKKYPNYGVCLDYGHAWVYGTDIEYWIQELVPYVKHIHINDNDLKKDLHLAVGSGAINWNEFIGFYNQYFSQCSILVEIYDVEQQRNSLEFLKGLL